MIDNCEGITGWGCIESPTVDWYKATSKKLEEEDGKKLPGFAFFHIPLPEYLRMWDAEPIYGVRNEEVCCSSVNTGVYSAFREEGNIVATFCGHDHNNDYWGDYHGIRLSFGRKTGHGGYGPPFYMRRGARVLEFQMKDQAEDPAPFSRLDAGDIVMDTWIREENGDVYT